MSSPVSLLVSPLLPVSLPIAVSVPVPVSVPAQWETQGVQMDINSPYLEPRPPPGGPPLLKSLLGRPMYLPGVGVCGRLVMEKSTLTCTMHNAMSHNYCACAQVSPAARQAPGRPSPSWPPPPARPSRSRRRRSPCKAMCHNYCARAQVSPAALGVAVQHHLALLNVTESSELFLKLLLRRVETEAKDSKTLKRNNVH